MRYPNIHRAIFLSRPNRFIAQVLLEGEEVTVHVKNTGRCRELLIPGATVYLEKSDDPARKTAFDLIAVEKKERRDEVVAPYAGGVAPYDEVVAPCAVAGGTKLINMDAQAPNKLFREWAEAGHFRPGLTLLRPETTFENSRFDFYWEAGERRDGVIAPYEEERVPRKGFVEVKGCTLEEDGWTFFPDAPTERGVKHLRELIRAKEQGYAAAVCFVIQMAGVKGFSPNDRTHPAFGEALRDAHAAGAEVLAYECAVAPDEVYITSKVPVKL